MPHMTSFPNRLQQTHATHPFDGHQKVNRTQNGPPTVTGFVHPGKALDPARRLNRGQIATKPTALDLEEGVFYSYMEQLGIDLLEVVEGRNTAPVTDPE